MEIKKTLVLSTAHLPENEFKNLGLMSEHLPFRFIEHEYGAILILAVDECNEQLKYMDVWEMHSPCLKSIVELAIANDITNIEFDRDGDVIEGLLEFDWENNSEPVAKDFKVSAVFVEENRYEYTINAVSLDDAKEKLKKFCNSDEGQCPNPNMDEFEGIQCFDAERAWSTKSFSHVID